MENKIIFPEPLKKGDNVYLLCLSSSMNPDNIQKGIDFVKELGFNPIVGKSIYSNHGGYMAGTVEIRINDLHEAFSRSDIKGIICMRGGFSSVQLLDKIDYNLIKNNPKVFVGYSDVTNLHIVFNQKCNLGTYHGPMVESNMINNFNEYTKNDFFKALIEKKWKYEAPLNMPLKLLENKYVKNNFFNTENVSGIITGGNLSLVVTTLGTKNEIDTKGKILFLEDISEEIGRIDRMFHHLKLSGKFDDCSGIILGNFDDCNNRYDDNYTLENLFNDFFQEINKPVFYNFESGHKKPDMATVPLGANCILNITNKEIYFEK